MNMELLIISASAVIFITMPDYAQQFLALSTVTWGIDIIMLLFLMLQSENDPN